MNRAFLATVVALGTSAGALLLAAGRDWVTLTATTSGLPSTEESLTGADLVPLVGVAGLVALAGIAGVLATRGPVRRAVGLLLCLVGVACGVQVLRWRGELGAPPGTTVVLQGWWLVAIAGAALLLAAGLAVLVRSGSWPALGARYRRRDATAPAPADPWASLDLGQDPTN